VRLQELEHFGARSGHGRSSIDFHQDRLRFDPVQDVALHSLHIVRGSLKQVCPIERGSVVLGEVPKHELVNATGVQESLSFDATQSTVLGLAARRGAPR
jgi:hypothetical protein